MLNPLSYISSLLIHQNLKLHFLTSLCVFQDWSSLPLSLTLNFEILNFSDCQAPRKTFHLKKLPNFSKFNFSTTLLFLSLNSSTTTVIGSKLYFFTFNSSTFITFLTCYSFSLARARNVRCDQGRSTSNEWGVRVA